MICRDASKEIEKEEHHHEEKEGKGLADVQVGEAREGLNLLCLDLIKRSQNRCRVDEGILHKMLLKMISF